MKTRVIPAQITTVEDKIIGNFSLIQILILLSPVLVSTVMFVVIPPAMEISGLKMALMLLIALIGGILSIRIKGQLIFQWMLILAGYNLRPKFYVFDKNERAHRELFLPDKLKRGDMLVKKKAFIKRSLNPRINVTDLVKLENFIAQKGLDIRFRSINKGGLSVAFEKITK